MYGIPALILASAWNYGLASVFGYAYAIVSVFADISRPRGSAP